MRRFKIRHSALDESLSKTTVRRQRRAVALWLLLCMAYLIWCYVRWEKRREEKAGGAAEPRTVTIPQPVKQEFPLMGGFAEIILVAPPGKDAEALITGARNEMTRLESIMNDHDPKSFVSRLNDLPPSTPLRVRPEEAEVLDVLESARRISELSGGAFDITFASVGRFWDFDPNHPRLPTREEIEKTLPKIDYRRVVVDRTTSSVLIVGEETRIGLGGIAEGTAADKAVTYLRSQGVSSALVNVSGDMFALGEKAPGVPWEIGLQDPRDKSRLLFRIALKDRAIATSGDYEKSFIIDGKRYHHILDPRTGMPTRGLISVTVLHPKAETADALATTIFVLGPKTGLELAEKLPDVEAILIDENEKIVVTSGLKNVFREVLK